MCLNRFFISEQFHRETNWSGFRSFPSSLNRFFISEQFHSVPTSEIDAFTKEVSIASSSANSFTEYYGPICPDNRRDWVSIASSSANSFTEVSGPEYRILLKGSQSLLHQRTVSQLESEAPFYSLLDRLNRFFISEQFHRRWHLLPSSLSTRSLNRFFISEQFHSVVQLLGAKISLSVSIASSSANSFTGGTRS